MFLLLLFPGPADDVYYTSCIHQQLATNSKISTCLLDPVPIALVKGCLPALSLLIVSTCFRPGTVPPTLKMAAITPIWKRHGWEPDDLNNFWPISNLFFLVRILELVGTHQLQQHVSDHELYEPLQSFRAQHSIESALVEMTNYLLKVQASSKSCLLNAFLISSTPTSPLRKWTPCLLLTPGCILWWTEPSVRLLLCSGMLSLPNSAMLSPFLFLNLDKSF